MTAVMIPASMLVEEKEQHTLKAVLSAPLSYADLVVGKGIAGLMCALLCGAITLALNDGLTGNVCLTGLVLLLTSVFLVEVGLLLGSLFDSLATLNVWSFVALVPLTLPAVVVPATNLGLLDVGTGERVLHLIPTYYAVDAVLRTVSGTASVRAVGIDLAVLSASALVLLAVTLALHHSR
jgi:ABC-2 type transport system permease protein